jgi:hypothetical protein
MELTNYEWRSYNFVQIMYIISVCYKFSDVETERIRVSDKLNIIQIGSNGCRHLHRRENLSSDTVLMEGMHRNGSVNCVMTVSNLKFLAASLVLVGK